MTPLAGLAIAAVSAWLGVTAFFSFAAAPVLFTSLDRARAGQIVGALLPQYYAAGIALSALALVLLLVAAAWGRDEPRWGHLTSAAFAAAMVLMLGVAVGNVLPRANAARAVRDDRAFAAAHRAAVQLNGLTMLAGVVVVVVELVSGARRRRR